jgi:o-succinylbenzoate synthase
VRIHHACRDAGIPCWVGGMLESAVGASICVALAMLDNFTYPADIFPSDRFYHEDLADPPIRLERSSECAPVVRAPDVLPEPVEQRLDWQTVERAVISA